MRCSGAQAAVDHYRDVNSWLEDINLAFNPVGSYTSCVFLVIDLLVRQNLGRPWLNNERKPLLLSSRIFFFSLLKTRLVYLHSLNKLDKFCAAKFDEQATVKDKVNIFQGMFQDTARSTGPRSSQLAKKALKVLKDILYRGLNVLGKLGIKPCVSSRPWEACIAKDRTKHA